MIFAPEGFAGWAPASTPGGLFFLWWTAAAGHVLRSPVILCTIRAPVQVRAEDGLDRPFSPWSLTRLTVLTVSWVRFSPMAVILMVRVPDRPSRPKTISITSAARRRGA